MATEKQLLNLANMILNDPALEAVHKRVAEKMLERFRGGSLRSESKSTPLWMLD